MFHQWTETVKRALKEIEKRYPAGSPEERKRLRERFVQIKRACDNLLEAWADIEDRIVRLVHAYPELAEEGEELEGEFELDEMVVRRFRQGQGFYRLNMFVEAEEAFREVVEEEPEFLLGRVYLALSHFQKWNTDEAYRHFQLIASTTNHDVFIAFAHHMMGCVRVREGDERGAIRQFRKALSHRQNEADTWFNLGACHYRLGEYHEAIPCFYQALLLDENDGEAMWMLANCHRKLKQWDSVAYWRMLAFEKTDSLQAMETIARDYEEMGETEKALSWYRKILSRDARRIGAYQGMGWNTWVAGRGQEALAWLKKGLSLAPGDPDLLFTYAWILLEMGDVEKVEAIIRRIPVEWTDQPLWLVIRSRVFTRRTNFEEAQLAAERVIEQEKPRIRALGHYQLGRVLLEKGDAARAAGHFRKARELDAGWKEPLFYEGVCHMLEGRPEETRNCWRELVKG
jgi:tetratricopeptide (TPR) repeat protein